MILWEAKVTQQTDDIGTHLPFLLYFYFFKVLITSIFVCSSNYGVVKLVCGWLWRSGATILLKVGSSFSAYWARNDIKLKIFRFVFVIMITFAGLVVVSTFKSWSSFDSTANQLKPNQPWIPVWKSEWMRLGLRSQIGVRVAIHIMVSDFFTALALYNWQALVWWVNINFFFPQPLFSFLHCFWLCCLRM